jgi:hypothetical protein
LTVLGLARLKVFNRKVRKSPAKVGKKTRRMLFASFAAVSWRP